MPIQVTLFGAPFKSKNPLKNQSRTLPDLAEVMFILQLYTLYRTVKSVYKPGVEIHLIHDGVYYAAPCDIPASDAAAYREYFANLLKLSPDFEDCIKTHELTELIAKTGIDQEAYFNLAADMANQWLTSPDANHEVSTAYKRAICSMCPLKIQRDRFASAVNQYLKERRVEDSEIHRLVLNAVYEYKKRQIVVYDLKDPRDVFFPDAIHASASNHKDKLPMWLVQRDKSLLPWHGRGVVKADLSLRIYYEQDITANAQYRPIFLEGEETPFMYSAAPLEKLIVS